MTRVLLALALTSALSIPVFAQTPQPMPMPMPGQMPAVESTDMPVSGAMRGMSDGQMRQMRQMHRKMGQLMRRMESRRMTPERRAEIIKQMAPMMKAMMPMMQEMMKDQTMPTASSGTPAASTAGYQAAMMKMHADMSINYSGDADADFARGMIPHHEGAVAMANILLQYGKSLELSTLAEGIVKGQTAEITVLRDWLAAKKQ